MRTSRNLTISELKVGIVIIVALFLAAITILQLGGTSWFTRSRTYYVRLDNSYGLKVGNSVRLAGLDVGNVDGIGFPSTPGDKRIIIRLKVLDRFADKIRLDSVASIGTIGLLGDKYVDISVGSLNEAIEPDKGELKSEGEMPLNKVLSGAKSGLEGLNLVLAELRTTLKDINSGQGTVGMLIKDPELYQQLTKTAAEIEKEAATLRQSKGSLGKLVNDPRLYNNLLQVSAKAKEVADKLGTGSFARLSDDKEFYQNLHDASENLKEVSASSKALVKNLETGSLAKLSEDKELYAKIDRAAGRLDALMGKLESGEGSAGKFIGDKKLYDNMNKFFEDADTLVVDVKKNPGRYVKISIF